MIHDKNENVGSSGSESLIIKALSPTAIINSKFEAKMSRKGNLNRYYVRIYPEKPKVVGKTCYTKIVVATNKSCAIKQAGNLAFKLGIEARQVTVFGYVFPKSKKRLRKLIDDYIEERQEMVRIRELKLIDKTNIVICP